VARVPGFESQRLECRRSLCQHDVTYLQPVMALHPVGRMLQGKLLNNGVSFSVL
jgi:hypothetical protein